MRDPHPRSSLAVPARRLHVVLLAGLAVLVLSVLAVELRPPGAPVALWWPAAAAAAAAALTMPAGSWRTATCVVVAAGSGLANVVGGRPLLVALAFGLSNGLEAFVVASLYGKRDGGRRELNGLAALCRLLTASGLGALLIGLGAGTTIAIFLDGSFLGTARSVLVTHGSALLMFLPLALLPRAARQVGHRHRTELLAVLGLQALTVGLVFGPGQDLPLTPLVVVWVVLAALRLSPLTTHAFALASVVAVAVMTLLGNGPYAAAASATPMVAVNLVQVFAVVVIAVELTVVLTVADRRRALQEQVALRQELARQVAFVEALMDNLDAAVVACDAQGRVTYLNTLAARLSPRDHQLHVGMELHELPSSSGFCTIDGEPLSVQDLPLLRALHGELPAPVLLTHTVDGGTQYLRTAGRRIHGQDGSPLGAVTSTVDLTREITLQEELRRARERAEALWSGAPVGITEASADGTTLSANARFCDMLGYTPEELIGRSAHTLVAPEQAEAVQAGIASLNQGERYTSERLYLHKDGRRVPVQVSATALRDAEGRIDRLAAFYVDVTEVHAQRDALAEAQRVGRLGSFQLDPLTWQPVPTLELCRLWGHDAVVPVDLLRTQMLDEDLPQFVQALQTFVQTGARSHLTFRVRRADTGETRTIRSSLEIVRDAQGRPVSGSGTHQDVTELVHAEEQARQAKQYVEAVLAANPDFLFVTDLRSGSVEYGSPGKRILGRAGEDVVQMGCAAYQELVHPDDLVRLSASDTAAGDLEEGQVLQTRIRAQHADGTWRWLSRRITPFRRGQDGTVTHVLGIARDITDTVKAEEHLRQVALHDPLTGLPNRALLHDRVAEALHRAAEHGHDLALLYLDLDGFKKVNDSAGHAAGDEVLRLTADRLRGVVRLQDTVSRLGGDEFVVLLEATQRHLGEPVSSVELLARELADRILELVREPLLVAGRTHTVGASIGIRCVRSDAAADLEVRDVLEDADAAMYDVKGRGKHDYAVFGSHRAGPDRLPAPRSEVPEVDRSRTS